MKRLLLSTTQVLNRYRVRGRAIPLHNNKPLASSSLVCNARSYVTKIKNFHYAGTYTSPEYDQITRDSTNSLLKDQYNLIRVLETSIVEKKSKEITMKTIEELFALHKELITSVVSPFQNSSNKYNDVAFTLTAVFVWPIIFPILYGYVGGGLNGLGVGIGALCGLFFFQQKEKKIMVQLCETFYKIGVTKSEYIVLNVYVIEKELRRIQNHFEEEADAQEKNEKEQTVESKEEDGPVDLKQALKTILDTQVQIVELFQDLDKQLQRGPVEYSEVLSSPSNRKVIG